MNFLFCNPKKRREEAVKSGIFIDCIGDDDQSLSLSSSSSSSSGLLPLKSSSKKGITDHQHGSFSTTTSSSSSSSCNSLPVTREVPPIVRKRRYSLFRESHSQTPTARESKTRRRIDTMQTESSTFIQDKQSRIQRTAFQITGIFILFLIPIVYYRNNGIPAIDDNMSLLQSMQNANERLRNFAEGFGSGIRSLFKWDNYDQYVLDTVTTTASLTTTSIKKYFNDETIGEQNFHAHRVALATIINSTTYGLIEQGRNVRKTTIRHFKESSEHLSNVIVPPMVSALDSVQLLSNNFSDSCHHGLIEVKGSVIMMTDFLSVYLDATLIAIAKVVSSILEFLILELRLSEMTTEAVDDSLPVPIDFDGGHGSDTQDVTMESVVIAVKDDTESLADHSQPTADGSSVSESKEIDESVLDEEVEIRSSIVESIAENHDVVPVTSSTPLRMQRPTVKASRAPVEEVLKETAQYDKVYNVKLKEIEHKILLLDDETK